MRKFYYWAALIFFLGGCTTTPEVQTSADETINLNGYQTFAWLPNNPNEMKAAENSMYNFLLNNQITETKIKDQVSKVLMDRGMIPNMNEPDVLLQYHIVFQERETVTEQPLYSAAPNTVGPTPWNFGPRPEFQRNRLQGNYTVYPYTYNYVNGINMYNTTTDGVYYGSLYPSYYIGSYFEKSTFQEGTMVIDVIDRKKNRLVWRGWTTEPYNDAMALEDFLGPQISTIMDRFPLYGSGAGSPADATVKNN